MRRAAILLVALVMLLASLGSIASAAPIVPEDVAAGIAKGKASGVYIAILSDDPALVDDDGEPGPAPGSPEARARAEELRSSHDRILDEAAVPREARLYDYVYAVNGFAVALDDVEAARLAALSDVAVLIPDETRRLATDSSPGYLELDQPQGPWATGYTGEGVVVGVVDTGIWPEHPSFADHGGYGPAPARFTGTACELGHATAAGADPEDADVACNGKLLSAQAFGAAFHDGAGAGLDPDEYLSARDADGHGSHVAATAVGNGGVDSGILGAGWGSVSGVAPRAHLAVYKACWSRAPGIVGCSTADLVAAIDQAVADGVDVLAYSIGSSSERLAADHIAFLFAADAGVVVATSAGNDGPGASTIGSPAGAPWVTTVAAATQDRTFQGQVILGDGTALTGVSVTGGTEELPLVDGADAGNALCDPSVTFASSIEGAVVVCSRGEVSRVDKSAAVREQGGAGMILVNDADSESLHPDNYHVPTLHVTASEAAAIAAYLDSAGGEATASFTGGVPGQGRGSVIIGFSSRGPNELSEDILKPDLAAPGVDILAAGSPTALLGPQDEMFRVVSGTSAAAAHVAGVFALVKHAHPDWTPAMVKSALVTSARDDVWLEDGETPADAFAMGGGYLWPGAKVQQRGTAFNPGLVYDAGLRDYAAFTCGAGHGVIWAQGTCEALDELGYRTVPSDLNVPSIGVADLVGATVVTRSVTSVADKIRVFEAQVREPPGYAVEVEPATLTLAPGETAEYTVTITRTRAPLQEWRFGNVTWRADGYEVESPVAVRAAEFAASEETFGEGASGEASFPVAFGYSGDYSVHAVGVTAAVTESSTVDDDPENDVNRALASGVGLAYHTVSVPEGSAYTRVALFDDLTDGNDDLDLYVFAPDGAFLAASGSTTSTEEVGFQPTESGDYTVVVHGWETDGSASTYILSTWVVPFDAEGTLTVASAPSRAEAGATGSVAVAWSGLIPGTAHLGAVSHVGPSGSVGLTLVSIEPGTDASEPSRPPGPGDVVAPVAARNTGG